MIRPTDKSDFEIDFYEAVATMPQRERMVARLFIQGFEPDEIGCRIGVSTRHVYTILKNLEVHFI